MFLKNNISISSNCNLILGCYISGVFDVNRNTTLEDDSYQVVESWVESLILAKQEGIIFHNNLSDITCKKYENKYISYVKIEYNPAFNPNVFRYFVYRNFLKIYAKKIKKIFITDISDVELIKNPFNDPYFIENPTFIFCGDEPKKLDNPWMNSHSTHLRENIPGFLDYENKFKNETLLNCGIIGAETLLFQDFIEKLCAIHQQANQNNLTAFTGDMGAFNYLIRTQFNNKVLHGSPINTVFKLYENERTDCWFKHK